MHPIVRYMILCEGWEVSPDNPRRVNIIGLLMNIHSTGEGPYPLLYEELCVFLVLTDARGVGSAQIVCVFEETGERVFGSPKHAVAFGGDPLEIVAVPFRIQNCFFPSAGLYSVQFWYNDEMIEERLLRLR